MASAEALFARGKILPSGVEGGAIASSAERVLTQESSSDQGPDPGTVAYTGEDVERIPGHLISDHSTTARRLDLSFNRLSSLEGVERFSVLEELVLDNNKLTDESFSRLPKLPHLTTLTANNNKITDTEQLLGVLEQKTPKLRYLSLLGNLACPNELLGDDHDDKDYQRYRYFVLYKLPQLTFLDSRPVNSEERREAKRVGQFMRVIKPATEVIQSREKSAGSEDSHYTPLPESADNAGKHRGVFGQCKYVYYGKHSEGNRFIRNNQL